MNMKSTAATRVVTEDFEVPALIDHIDAAQEVFEAAATAKLLCQSEYDDAKRLLEQRTAEITATVIEAEYSNNSKVTQAAVDRAVKLSIAADKRWIEIENNLSDAKAELDNANTNYEVARLDHRTSVAKANLAAASLTFMGQSKAARSAALGILGEL
jgi:hypothetical protein